jgi:hypothetical protein
VRTLCAISVVLLLVCGVAFGQSAKNAAQLSNVALLDWQTATNTQPGPDPAWKEVLRAGLKASQQKDLFIGVSLETALFTKTYVKSANRYDTAGVTTDTSSATSGIKIRVKMDDKVIAEPGIINFDKRVQTLSATLGQVFTGCVDADLDGHITLDECTATPEDIELMLKTMAAHHFNFALADVGVGYHEVSVEVAAEVNGYLAGSAQGSFEAKAAVGKGSLQIDEVRMVKGVDLMKKVDPNAPAFVF